MTIKSHFVSRSAHELDNKCHRLRFLNTIMLGGGITPAFDGPELIFGTALHAGHEILWLHEGDVEKAALAVKETEKFTQLPETQQWLCEALIRAYAKVRYPIIREFWDPLFIEREVQLQLGESAYGRPLIFLAKPDAILQHKQIGTVRYEELKSTKILTSSYLESWNYAVQLTGGMRAVQETLGIEVDDALMRFFYKGAEAEDYLRSPFTSAWKKAGEIVTYQPKRPQYFKGWERFNVHESGMTPAEWIEELSTETLEEQLPQTQPLMFNQKAVDEWLRQIAYREQQIADTVDAIDVVDSIEVLAEAALALDRVFPKNTGACRPAMGLPCPYISICWNEMAFKDPLNHGFVKRVPHHETERKAMDDEG